MVAFNSNKPQAWNQVSLTGFIAPEKAPGTRVQTVIKQTHWKLQTSLSNVLRRNLPTFFVTLQLVMVPCMKLLTAESETIQQVLYMKVGSSMARTKVCFARAQTVSLV